MSAKRTLGLIGIGHIAGHQLAAIANSTAWRLVGACDVRPERQALLSEGVPFFTAAEDLLGRIEADLFLVSTPNASHYDVGKLVLEAGRNLLLEKPCCQSREQMRDLQRIAEAGRVFFSVALHASQAPDLLWFVERHGDWGLSLSDITAFEAGFFDPLVQGGSLAPGAGSLGDSWFDSGINAIGVIGSLIPAESLKHGRHGRGTIETNWTLGINRKTTLLRFEDGRVEVLLDHSRESVILMENGAGKTMIDLRNGRERLFNHYVNVLSDAHGRLDRNEPNIAQASMLHNIFFDAMEQGARLG
jgi:D-galactose 1-dehydrogenase